MKRKANPRTEYSSKDESFRVSPGRQVSVPYSGTTTIAALRSRAWFLWPSDDLNDKNFPQAKERCDVVQLGLARFKTRISTVDAFTELKAAGLRSANAAELLAFAVEWLKHEKRLPIIGLGDAWLNHNDYYYSPCLDVPDWSDEWACGLFPLDTVCNSICRFAVVLSD